MTSLQYHAVMIILNEISKFKMKSKPMAVI